jgi:ABC-2 type transport system ATP-binding protein
VVDFQTQKLLMNPLISIHGLTKKYGSVTALEDIDVELEAAGPVGLIGKNGAGKTTLLSVLSGALRPDRGVVKILGSSPESSAVKGRISILLQDANFKHGIPVATQLRHFARLLGMSKAQAEVEIRNILERTNNTAHAFSKPRALSYGQRKRLAIVQALIGKPELVLLDEPTSGLDPVAASEVRGLIREWSRDTAFIVSSHNLYEIEDICKTIILLDRGRLITHAAIADFAAGSNILNLVLNRPLTEQLRFNLLNINEITEIITHDAKPEKFSIQVQSDNPDKLQLQIQSLVVEHGFSIVMFSRGKTLADGVIDLVAPGK